MAQESYHINLMGLFIFLLLIRVSPAAGRNAEDHVLQFKHQKSEQEKCDIFSGEWIYDPSFQPSYTGTTCDVIHEAQNCQKNGRPDETYIHWRWQPYGCDLPSFDPEKFLKAMENKRLGGIGDSLMRNQLQSLVCQLSKVEKPALFSSHQKWHFPSYNFTVEWAVSVLLLKAKDWADIKDIHVHLDVLDDSWTTRYHDFDYVLIGDGAWFDKPIIMLENDTVVGCTDCHLINVPHLGRYYLFRKALDLTFRFITAASDHTPKPEMVVVRTQSPNHFEYGDWDENGFCNRTLPFNGIGDIPDDLTNYEDGKIMQSIVKQEFAKAMAAGNKNGIHLQLLDIYYLSLLRPDGHPYVYRKKGGTDCLHWCLPGVIDTWNDLLMATLLGDENMKRKPL